MGCHQTGRYGLGLCSYRKKRICGWEGEPLLWTTSAPVPAAGQVWLALHDMQDKTGLLANLDAAGPEGRPWDSGELGGGYALSEVDQLDPAAVLAGSWADSLDPEDDGPEQAEVIAPFTLQFPGLARGGTRNSVPRSWPRPSIPCHRPGSAWSPPLGRPMCWPWSDTPGPLTATAARRN